MVWVAGHFGEWVQGHVGGDVGGHVALVTLCCPTHGVRAGWRAAPDLALYDPQALLGHDRARAILMALGLAPRGAITIMPDLPPGGGAGMSTAGLVALARAAGAAEQAIAPACLAVEGAVDPLMLALPDSVLWAPRAARAVMDLPRPPAAEIVGGFWGDPVVTDPADTVFPAVDDLVAEWARGPDLAAAARLASLSAARTTALRGPLGDPTPDLAARLGALGWARAHTGSARALIFAPGQAPRRAEPVLAAAGYGGVIRFATGARP